MLPGLPLKKIAVFVDVQNIYYTCRQAYGRQFNYRRFWQQLQHQGDIVQATADRLTADLDLARGRHRVAWIATPLRAAIGSGEDASEPVQATLLGRISSRGRLFVRSLGASEPVGEPSRFSLAVASDNEAE